MASTTEQAVNDTLLKKLGSWLVGSLATAIIPTAVFTFGYIKNVTTSADVEERLNRYDHGSETPLDGESRKARPPLDGMASSIADAWNDIKALKERAQQDEALVSVQHKQLIELWRWHVRWLAADAEPDRRKRMSAGEVAVGKFNAGIAEGMTPDAAARFALESNPYR